MKNLLFLFSVIIFSLNAFAQITFEENLINNETDSTDGAYSIYAIDIDGDGDIDVLSASVFDDKIVWYENTDGLGSFGTQQIISNDADNARAVFAIDIDGDGDVDVLSASCFDDKIAWYENTDGLGSFGTEQIITTNTDCAFSVFATDIDGDGDMDVLSASNDDNKIAWYENIDGLGSFGSQQLINTNAVEAYTVFATDIDGDGDMDVLSASYGDDKIIWYENTDGLGSFDSYQTISTIADGASSVYAIDIDGDGYMDVLSAFIDNNKIVWYKNLDGLGSFTGEYIISNDASGAISVFAQDMDGDGDIDVLSASYLDDTVAWYENTDGLGNFGAKQIISNDADSACAVFATDINNDGKMDVLSVSWDDDKVAWHKNMNGIGVEELANDLQFNIFPNPTNDIFNIVVENESIALVEVFNVLG